MVYCGEHKMSKSLGNMVFVADLLKWCPADALRLHLLSHHYRKPWNHPIDADLPTCELSQRLTDAFGAQARPPPKRSRATARRSSSVWPTTSTHQARSKS